VSALICPKCDREIRPGDAVVFVGPTDPTELRIFTDDDVLVVHAACEEDAP